MTFFEAEVIFIPFSNLKNFGKGACDSPSYKYDGYTSLNKLLRGRLTHNFHDHTGIPSRL